MQELIKPIVRVGNSSGIVLPKEWLNGTAKITLIKKPLNIKKDILEILDPYLEDIIGIYLTGSHARNEQTQDSDIDILAISHSISKKIKQDKYEIEIHPLNKVKTTLKNHPIMIYPRLIEAKPIINKSLLQELTSIKLTKNSISPYLEETKRIIKINKEFIELDKLDGEKLQSNEIIYSTILRLRGLYLINTILKGKKYAKKEFLNWLKKQINSTNKETTNLYNLYISIRDNKQIPTKNVKINQVEKLINLLEKEVKKYAK